MSFSWRVPIVEVPTEKFPRNKTTAANITAPAANTIIITTHIIVPRCKYHNPNYTRYSPRCKYHSPRHTLSEEIECIADIFYQKSPAPCSRHRLFHQKRCIVDGNIASAPFLCTRHKVFQQKGCIADKMTRIPPISSSRYRFFPPKGCVADRKHMP